MNCAECRTDGTSMCIACLRGRLRETAQILIAALGADGPMDAEDAARRAVAKLEIADRERQNAFDAHAKLSALVDFPYVGQWAELVRIITEALAAKEMRAEKAEREIAEVRSAVCADDTETTVDAALHLAQAAEARGSADAFCAHVEALRLAPGDVLVVRVPEIPIASNGMMKVKDVMRREDLKRQVADLLRTNGRSNASVIVPLDVAMEAVPRERLLAILGGDNAERTCAWTRVLPEGLADNDPLRCMTGCGHRVPSQLPFDCHGDWMFCPYCDGRIVAADGEHVCAPEEGA